MLSMKLVLFSIMSSLVISAFATPPLPPGYHLVFNQTFNNPNAVLSIPPGTGWSPGGVYTWMCHTPWSGDFGVAYFSGPQDAKDGLSPFYINSKTGQLSIVAWFDSTAPHWRSGLLSTMGYNGLAVPGGLVTNGYFEVEFQPTSYPNHPPHGIWPAFFLASSNSIKGRTTNSAEIDVIEAYGVDLTKVHQHLHLWAPAGNQLAGGFDNTTTMADISLAMHRYGVFVGTTKLTWYIDDVPVCSCPATPETELPMCALVDFALGGGWPIDDLALIHGAYPPRLWVNYVRIWSL